MGKKKDAPSIGEQIRACREAANLSQDGLAALVGTGQNRISQWESGQVEPRLGMLHRIAEAMGATLTVELAPK